MRTEISLSSNTLFHFTSKAENLISILKDGFKPRFCLEQFGSRDIILGRNTKKDNDWEEAIPICCFCDLPISHISSHLEFYGSYGLGLSKEWGIKNGLTPLTYVHRNSIQIKYINELADIIWQVAKIIEKKEGKTDPAMLLIELGGFFKPYEGKMFRLNKYVTKRFYDEREWRYIPLLNPNNQLNFSEDYRLSKEEFLNEIKRAKANDYLAENHLLKFGFSDIRYIIVKNDYEAISMTESINSMKHFTTIEKTMLMTKIISTEQIKEDF